MSIARRSVAASWVALFGCAEDAPSSAPSVRELDASSLPATDLGHGSDAQALSCDPLGLDGVLEASPENSARALGTECFHSGAGRRKLVFEALCRRDSTCTKAGDGCLADYEARWQQRLHPRGLSVPCADALLDAMSCLAQARCDDARSCASWDERAEATRTIHCRDRRRARPCLRTGRSPRVRSRRTPSATRAGSMSHASQTSCRLWIDRERSLATCAIARSAPAARSPSMPKTSRRSSGT